MAGTTFPNATTTGVPAGTTLTAYTGPMTITQDGTVIDGKIINGTLRVEADNVVIKNSQINFTGWWGVDAEGAKNITVQDNDITGPGYSGQGNAAILGSGNFLRNDISKTSNGITLQGGASVVKGNYIHDLQAGGSDPHYDGIEVFGGQKNVLIDGNTIIARDTSNILISDLYGAVSNVTVSNNLLGGTPGYNIYVTGERSGTTGVSITNNTIAKGGYGYYYLYETNPTFSGNSELPKGAKLPISSPVDSNNGGSTGDGGTSGGGSTSGGGTSGGGGTGAVGIDTVLSSTTYHLGPNDKNLTLTGKANINGYGNDGDNVLRGNSGHNTLHGGAGSDTLNGGAGNDTYVVDSASDKVVEYARGGTDTVRSSVSITLDANVENLTLTGSASLSGTGNGLANVLNGNAGGNALSGKGAHDTLNGAAGNDVLKGGNGNDVLTGGIGKDTFVFDTALSSRMNVDRITDFSVVDDVIHLDNAVFAALAKTGALSSVNFVANTTGLAQDANDHIIYETDTGKLFYDGNGQAAGGSVHFATLTPHLALAAADFMVI